MAVVIPNHSRVAELKEALASVAAQDYPGQIHTYLVYRSRTEIEPLLSTLGDEVTAIPSIEDDGHNPIALKRNAGLRASSEDLVAFLDDDDIWHPQKLSCQIEVIGREPDVVAVTSRSLGFTDELVWPTRQAEESWKDFTRLDLLGFAGFATSAMILRGDVARDLEFDERPEWLAVEDYEFKSRVSMFGLMRQMDEIHLGYRVSPSSSSSGDARAMTARVLDVLREIVERPGGWWVPRFVALHLVVEALCWRRQPQSLFSEDLLTASLTGKFFGPVDRFILLTIRASWRIGFDIPLMRRLVWQVMRGAQLVERWRVRRLA